ncbi:hypothetical protein QQS21_010139 [Conoideocrella luteorostrata]|uniref:Integral membrane protein n=1 Tax=Conoideocrella luteorostrata TaxID=1105319 RepID=A0AAJ0CGL5_9HYPO|nr:hypothetical protein QQS21_010139 [Conoideocrella luteorostrata]
MGVGRFFCVALPLILTVASIVALLIATLSGVSHNQLWMFQIDTTNLSINPADAAHIAGKVGINLRDVKTDNITAVDLPGIANVYDVDLWGYCSTDGDKKRQCTKAEFDWANSALNTSKFDELVSKTGVKIQLPNEIKDALKTFRTVAKWTDVAFIIALVALGVELVLGIFANCSRVMSCLTWVVAGITAVLVGVAAGLATAMSTIVVGTVESTAKYYGVKGRIGGRFLATVWIATAFAIAAAFFWIFTICCCKPERRQKSSRSRHADSDGEKLLPTGAYRPLSNNNFEMAGGQQSGVYHPNPGPQLHGGYASAPRHPSGHGRTDLAYEPYSHRA